MQLLVYFTNLTMKRKHILLLLFACLMTTYSCHDKLFDFDIQHIEADGDWGIPLFNGSFSVGELLDRLDSVRYLQVGEDGTLLFRVDEEIKNVVSLKDMLHIGDQTFDKTSAFKVPHLPDFGISGATRFSLNTQDFFLKRVEFKTGTLSLYFNIEESFPYSAELSSENILDGQGNPIVLHLSDLQQQQIIDLSNCIMETDAAGFVSFSASVLVGNSIPLDTIHYSCHVETRNITIKNVVGMFRAIPFALDESAPIDIPQDLIQLDQVGVNNIHVRLFSRNNLCAINGILDELSFVRANGTIAPLLPAHIPFNSPLSSEYILAAETHIPSVSFTSDVDSLRLKCHLTLNPNGFSAGDISINENTALDLKINAEIPTNISIDNAIFKDTMDNALHHLADTLDFVTIESLLLRIAFTNALPVDLIPYIAFYNSETGEVYVPDLNGLQIHGSYDGQPVVQQAYLVEIRKENIATISAADKMILKFTANTQGHGVTVNSSQFIKANIGARIKYSSFNL